MDLVAAFFAIVGSACITSKQRKTRFWAFMSFNIANILWILLSVVGNIPAGIFIQSCIFLLTSLYGTINNIKD